MATVMTTTGAFGFYAGLNLIAWGMIYCFVRETKQLTLEEIDRKLHNHAIADSCVVLTRTITEVFSVPTAQFLKHESSVIVPYLFKRHVLRRRIPHPPKFYEKQEIVEKSLS